MESPFFVARLILTFIFLMFSSTGFAQSNYELLTISSGVVNALNTAEEGQLLRVVFRFADPESVREL
jgi:hypothetical protein